MEIPVERIAAAVLEGRVPYDKAPAEVQVLVRAAWNERMASVLAGLNYESKFNEAGLPWVEADSEGRTIKRHPTTREE